MQIIEDPIGAVEVKVLTSQTHTYNQYLHLNLHFEVQIMIAFRRRRTLPICVPYMK